MGCDIHAHAEKKVDGKWVSADVNFDGGFRNRSYGTFGFLAGVRNYSGITPLSMPRGVPSDVSDEVKEESDGWGLDGHSHSWLSLEELQAFNYDAEMEDRRVTRQTSPNLWNGGCTCDPGEGEKTTYREFLGECFFADLKKMADADAERVVF